MTATGICSRTPKRLLLLIWSSSATKTEIKQAVEKFFKVDVTKVNTAKYKGKVKGRYYFRKGRRAKWKKAYVTLQEGQNIPDLFTDMGT